LAAADGEREITALTREELYERVWSEAMATLAPQLGLSDVGLKKICNRMRVPTPYRGYWARKEASQSPKRTPLPKLPASAPSSMLKVQFGRLPKAGSKATEPRGPVADQVRYEAIDEHRILVPEMLGDPHSLVASSVRLLRKAKAKNDHLLIVEEKKCLAVTVTLGTVDRAMCVFDALLKALESRDYVVNLSEVEGVSSTIVLVGDERVRIAIDERVDRVERKPDPHDAKTRPWYHSPVFDYVPTGRLALRIVDDYLGVRRTWGDGAKQRVETCLNDFIVGIVAAAEALRTQRLEREARQRAWEEDARRQQVAEDRKLLESARIRALDQDLTDWRTSRSVREYVHAMRVAAERTSVGEPGSSLSRYLDWAERYADRLDPAAQVPTVPEDPQARQSYSYFNESKRRELW
jgi:hypothetical protein